MVFKCHPLCFLPAIVYKKTATRVAVRCLIYSCNAAHLRHYSHRCLASGYTESHQGDKQWRINSEPSYSEKKLKKTANFLLIF